MASKIQEAKQKRVPTFEEYAEERARQVRDSAANAILSQNLPNVPRIASRYPWSLAAEILGMSNEERIRLFGTADVETCLYTATSQYGDKGAKAWSNKALKANPESFGFVPVPKGEEEIGDLYQFSDEGGTPKHSAIYTGQNEEREPLVSYSRGGTGQTTITPDGELPTMVHNNGITDVVQKIGEASAYRYIGSPSKRREWAGEYYDKYYSNPPKPLFSFRDTEYRFPFEAKKSDGGFLSPKDAWDALPLTEKAEMMRIAVNNGITDLSTIRQKYNEFAEGGSKEEAVNTDEQYLTTVEDTPIAPWQLDANEYKKGGSIHISPSKKGTFTAAAKKHGMGVQEFASKILANKDDYSSAMVKKANFARNASKWKHGDGGLLHGPIIDMAMANMYVDGGDTTPEGKIFQNFVVRASKDPMVTIARQNPEYRHTLAKIYDDEGFRVQGIYPIGKQEAERLLNVYNEAGRPRLKILPEGKTRAETRDGFIFRSRPTMYLSSAPEEGFDDLIAELAHPIQAKYGNNKSWRERWNPFYHTDDYKDKTRYDYPNTYESETHEDFEPLLRSYVLDNYLPGQRYITGNYEGEKSIGDANSILNPAFPAQVVDSARAYNRRKQDMKYQYKEPRGEKISRNRIVSF